MSCTTIRSRGWSRQYGIDLLAKLVSGGYSDLLNTLSSGGNLLLALRNGRAFEREADATGVALLEKLGLRADGIVELLRADDGEGTQGRRRRRRHLVEPSADRRSASTRPSARPPAGPPSAPPTGRRCGKSASRSSSRPRSTSPDITQSDRLYADALERRGCQRHRRAVGRPARGVCRRRCRRAALDLGLLPRARGVPRLDGSDGHHDAAVQSDRAWCAGTCARTTSASSPRRASACRAATSSPARWLPSTRSSPRPAGTAPW